MKYKIGEIVQVRPELEVGRIYYNDNSPIGDSLTYAMRINLGKEAEVVGYSEGKYLLKIDGNVALHQSYTDDMLRYPTDDLAGSDYLFNKEVEGVMAHLEMIQISKEIDKALDNGDKELFLKLTNEYNSNKKFLQKVVNIS